MSLGRVGALACTLSIVATTASADVCELMDRATADRFAERLHAAGSFIYGDWFRPVAVETVEVFVDLGLFSVLVNGTIVPDAAYTYVPGEDDTYVNVGLPLGCEGADVTPTVPRQAFVPDGTDPPPLIADATPRLIGIVESPPLYDAYLAMGELEMPVQLRAEPATSAPFAAEVATLEALETLEVDYDVLGAAVYGVDHGWHRVRRGETLAWLPPEAAGTFHRYPDLLLESLSYLDLGWDGRLYAEPRGDARRARLDGAWRATMGEAIDVDVRGLAVIDRVPWVLVDVIWPNPCDGDDPSPVATGWVPAFGTTGAANVWFYSRGC